MAKFSEHDVGLPGVDIAIKPVRSYVYGALASHLLGYVGAPDDTNTDEARKYTFYQGDVEGKSNVEKSMDQYLCGQPGIRVMRRNAKGVIDGVVREEAPKQGANVYLTIDARIQAVADEALRAVARGAAVVVDPNNGNVLAMASAPSFDPNTFIPSIKAKDWDELRKDEVHPLINRAVSAFPPSIWARRSSSVPLPHTTSSDAAAPATTRPGGPEEPQLPSRASNTFNLRSPARVTAAGAGANART